MLDPAGIVLQYARYAQVDRLWSNTVFAQHPHHRLYYIKDGEAEIRLTDTTQRLRKGHYYLLPAFRIMDAVCGSFLHHYYIHFTLEPHYHSLLFELHTPSLEIKPDCPELVLSLFQSLASHNRETSVHSGLLVQGTLMLLLSPFFQGAETRSEQRRRFAPVIAYMDGNLHMPIGIGELAELACLEANYFSSLFAQTFGITPKSYIIRKKLERAQLLLLDESRTIKDIALEVGYDNEMYFSRLFRQKVGHTPSEHRRRLLAHRDER